MRRCAGAGDLAEHRAVGESGAARVIEIEDTADQLACGIQAGNRFAVGRQYPRLGIDAQAPEGEGDAASNGGVSSVFAQFDFGIASPLVERPSLTFGLNAMSVRTAALYALSSASAASGSTSSSLVTSSSSVSAVTLVTWRILYSSLSCALTLASKICQANCPGCLRITPPYLA